MSKHHHWTTNPNEQHDDHGTKRAWPSLLVYMKHATVEEPQLLPLVPF